MHEVKRTLSNQIHRHKSISGTILTTILSTEIILSTESIL